MEKLSVDHCLKIADQQTYCEYCEIGFIPINGRCAQEVKFDDSQCNTLLNELCDGCNQGYFLGKDLFCHKEF